MDTLGYLVAYAKIVEDKDTGIQMQGVFFGGVGVTMPDADRIAKECVNTIKGGTIIPKVTPISGNCNLVEAMQSTKHKFDQIVDHMIQANNIINRRRK